MTLKSYMEKFILHYGVFHISSENNKRKAAVLVFFLLIGTVLLYCGFCNYTDTHNVNQNEGNRL